MVTKEVILICGTRGFDPQIVRDWAEKHLNFNCHIVIHGGCNDSPDVFWKTPKTKNIIEGVFNANWQAHGKAAGIFRNQAMVQIADKVIAFWDRESPGTKSTIEFAYEINKPIEIVCDTKDNVHSS